jgi:S-adenosylmethionine synthetase
MGFRYGNEYKITMCIPQIGAKVASIEAYKNNVSIERRAIDGVFMSNGVDTYELNINTRDNYEKGELYLTAIGSSIESGDEGLVGRGNRIQGFIAPMRPMSMEGAAGKNPVYHIGKIYYVVAQKISESIYSKLGIKNETVLVSQSGRDLLDPWIVFVHVPEGKTDESELEKIVRAEIASIPEITGDLINLKVSIC